MPVVIERWTGHLASQLQAAMRMTNESFAEHLGVAVRTVAAWHDRPEVVPAARMQEVLDAALERSGPQTEQRFVMLSGARPGVSDASSAQALTVAIAIVKRGSDALLVCRRTEDATEITWQFPAGVVKPGASPRMVAVRETLAETGVRCRAVDTLGSRLHPVTGVMCEYVLCEFLSGEPENLDVVENIDVTWVPAIDVSRFIPKDRIYPPVLTALEGADEWPKRRPSAPPSQPRSSRTEGES